MNVMIKSETCMPCEKNMEREKNKKILKLIRLDEPSENSLQHNRLWHDVKTDSAGYHDLIR